MIQQTTSRFPSAVGTNLAGSDFHFPQDLQSDLNLIIVHCHSWQQAVLDMWMKRAAAIRDRYEEFDVYECKLPPGDATNVEIDLRHETQHGICSYRERQKVIALHASRDALLRDLRVPNDRRVHVFLVGRDGGILWGAVGHPESSQMHSLLSTVHFHTVIGAL